MSLVGMHLQTLEQVRSLLQVGKLDAAEAALKSVLKVDRNDAEANHLLGCVAQQKGDFKSAEKLIKKSLKKAPNNTQAQNNLSLVLISQGKLRDAKGVLAKLLLKSPDYFSAYMNQAVVLARLGEADQAIEVLNKLLAAQPQHIEAIYSRATLYYQTGKFEEAAAGFDSALKRDPNHLASEYQYGVLLAHCGSSDQALERFDKVLTAKESFADAWHQKALVLMSKGSLAEANDCVDRALALKKQSIDYLQTKGRLLHQNREHEKAEAVFKGILDKQENYGPALSSLCWISNYQEGLSKEEVFSRHQYLQKFQQIKSKAKPKRKKSDSAIRVGYVSGDFYAHSVAYFFLPLLKGHSEAVETFCYYNAMQIDSMTEKLQGAADHWRDIFRLNDDQAAALIEEDKIDILVDLSGHSAGNRLSLFQRRAAPVQVTWLGFPNTTGLKEMDVRITSALADPEVEGAFHTECLERLPSFLCYSAPEGAPEVSALPASSSDRVMLGSFNNIVKVHDGVLDVWAKILERAPSADLLLKSRQLEDESLKREIENVFAQRGIDSSRLHLMGRIEDVSSHLEIYHRVDFALDPFPYNGTTTTFEAAWMGVPTLTLAGDRHAARVGLMINSLLGLDNWVAQNKEEYIQRACEHISNLESLSTLRAGLRTSLASSILMDREAFVEEMERVFSRLIAQ